jgi:DNA polymerase-3 subunit gamma/tau
MNHTSIANKYRPSSFSELKGQKVLVQTITNAIRSKKPFHAYLLCGIRGIGKTTSARIIAKTLNCFDPKISENEVTPCGKCKSCTAIQNASHPDIIELDAASKTGVNDMREVIESARYVPILSKYKLYIIDEVHMLSNSAFNALLKILEEPPANVIFIFATTEFRKIPMTVISRCQKFDFHRFNSEELVAHLKEISEKENIKYTMDGLKEIVKYSEGSVRDSLSLLETISMYEKDQIADERLVRKLLGISDSDCKYKLFEEILNGRIKEAIEIINEVYYKGEDLPKILEELLSVANILCKMITIKGYFENIDLPDSEKTLLKEMSETTDIISLTSIWQMVFKGISELKESKNKLQSIEMLMIRICHLSSLPTLEKIISDVEQDESPRPASSYALRASADRSNDDAVGLTNFRDMVELFRKHKEIILYTQLMEDVNLISFAPSRIEMLISTSLPNDFQGQVSQKLQEWTKQTWQIVISKSEISPDATLRLQEKERIQSENGIVKDILESFPGAKVKTIVGIDNT